MKLNNRERKNDLKRCSFIINIFAVMFTRDFLTIYRIIQKQFGYQIDFSHAKLIVFLN